MSSKKRKALVRRQPPPDADFKSFSDGYDAAIADVLHKVKENRASARHFEASWALGELQGELEEVQ